MEKYQVLARRYRPQKFREVIGQGPVVTTLKNALKLGRVAHAYLFCGCRGVGKTTLARLFAKALNCSQRDGEGEPCGLCPSCREIVAGQSLDVIEIDGASHRGIDDVRQINETVGYAPNHGNYKIYIIDEVHMLTKEAFNALLKTLEEPPVNVKFFFATTEPHKVLQTIISRCQRFDLSRISHGLIESKLFEIVQELKRDVEPEAIHLMASFADGSLRDAEVLLDQILCASQEKITDTFVRQTLGILPQEYFFAIDQAFSQGKAGYAFELTADLFHQGKDLAHFLQQWIEHVRFLSLAKMMGEKALCLPVEQVERYMTACRLYTQPQLLYLLEYLVQAEVQFHHTLVPRVFIEMTLLHAVRSKHRIPVEVLIRRLSEMEESLLKQSSVKEPVVTPQEEKKLEKEEKVLPSQHSLQEKHPSHYDTLIRFAAVELEGNVVLTRVSDNKGMSIS